MNNTKILVVTHKKFDSKNIPNGYQVIKVGNVLDSKQALEQGYLVDDAGENIAFENPWYCELTAQYWAWKNLDKDYKYVGICHYRRYFFDYKKDSSDFWDDVVSVEKINSILKKYKVIMSFPTVKYPGNSSLYKKMPLEKQDKHWVIINKIIKKDYPELYPTFKKIIYGRFITWGNMIITSRQVFDEYSEWLFEVLHKYDKEIEKRNEKRIPRVDGFLSELLLQVWMNSKFKKSEICYLEVRNTETDKFEDYQDNLKGRLIKFFRNHYHLLCLARYVRIGILLVLRRDKNR